MCFIIFMQLWGRWVFTSSTESSSLQEKINLSSVYSVMQYSVIFSLLNLKHINNGKLSEKLESSVEQLLVMGFQRFIEKMVTSFSLFSSHNQN